MFALGLILNVENKVCLCGQYLTNFHTHRLQSSYNFSSSVSFCCLCTQTQPAGHKSASLVQKHSHIHQVTTSKVLWGSHRRAAGRLLQTLHIGLKNPYQIMRSIVVIIVTFDLKRVENTAWSDLIWSGGNEIGGWNRGEFRGHAKVHQMKNHSTGLLVSSFKNE